jgi:hypothetical protein
MLIVQSQHKKLADGRVVLEVRAYTGNAPWRKQAREPAVATKVSEVLPARQLTYSMSQHGLPILMPSVVLGIVPPSNWIVLIFPPARVCAQIATRRY